MSALKTLRMTLRHVHQACLDLNIGVALKAGAAPTLSALRQSVLNEVPAFQASANPEILPSLAGHAQEHIAEIMRLLIGGTLEGFAFVKNHGAIRAEQHFPIEATLHAYRCGHKVLSNWMRESALATRGVRAEIVIPALAYFAIEYTDVVSTVFAAEYVAHARLLAESEGDRRTELMNALLTGADESDGRTGRLIKRAGYLEQRQSYCVCLIQPVDPTEMEHPARAQRIIDAASEAVVALPVRSLYGIRNNMVCAIFSDMRRLSGWTAPQAEFAGRLSDSLSMLGPSVLVGLSSDQPSTGLIPKALKEAIIALDFASVSERLVNFSSLPLQRLLLHRADDFMHSALPSWIDEFRRADTKLHGALSGTLRSYAEANMNILRAARILDVHPNTIYSRMDKIRTLTGLDGQVFQQLTELLLAVEFANRTR